MTTPRDALAAALTNSHPCPDPDMHAEDAVIVLSALAAEGWVLVRRGGCVLGREGARSHTPRSQGAAAMTPLIVVVALFVIANLVIVYLEWRRNQ